MIRTSDGRNVLYGSYVIGGDLNAHSAIWEDDNQQNRCGKQIAEILLDDTRITICTPKNLGTHPNPNGKESSTIDLTFSSPDLANLINPHVGPCWGSDHLPVITSLSISSSPIKTPNEHWKFNRNRWEEWNGDIECKTTPGILTAAETPNEAYQSFYSAIIEASNKHFKPKRINKEPKKPWWTPLCKKTTKEARKAYKLWRSTLLPSDKNNLNKLEAIKKRTIMAAKNQAWSNHIASMDKNTIAFWRFAKQMINKPSTPRTTAPITKPNGD
ncbi:Uncharacterized protein APZ42_011851 [Daphnia magna]|uniref:Endonuclease/exonuclease/phosphatase domain-containing protein n=1 Tax=Daphnia magna TaxID=35525 RepID=A0A162SFQ1_9CRUS|nr:Uncharacterized protein APZ42_011851 [Daphnia magna]